MWQPWEYKTRLNIAEKVAKFKKGLWNPTGKQRGDVTKFITQNKSWQEYVPPLGKYVDLFKAEPLHNTNNAWQNWFLVVLAIAMQYTNQRDLKAATVVSDLPNNSPLLSFLKCIKETLKCGWLYNSFGQWFREKITKGIQSSYRFTRLESKHFCWNLTALIQELLKITSLSKGSVVKLHSLALVGLKLRDIVLIYSRVEVSMDQLQKLEILCKHFFNAHRLLLEGITPTMWTIGQPSHIILANYRRSLVMSWTWIQCRARRQSTSNWPSMLKILAMTWVCLHGMVKREGSLQCFLPAQEEECQQFLWSKSERWCQQVLQLRSIKVRYW